MRPMIRCRKLHTLGCLSRKYIPKKQASRELVSPQSLNRNTQDVTPLTNDDIVKINMMFLSRTRGLEPDIEIKQLSQIRNEFSNRYKQRYLIPSKKWFDINWHNKSAIIKDESNGNSYSFQIKDLYSPLKVGDLILTTKFPNELVMCVDLPQSIEDPRYTFSTINGKLFFATRSVIQLRIPNRIPSSVKYLIQKESYPSSASTSSFPNSSKFESIGTIKGKINETYILPYLARQLVTSEYPANINKSAWLKLPIINKKLSILYRYLQDYSRPKQISFLNLVQLIESLELDTYFKNNENVKYIEALIESCLSLQSNNNNINPVTYLGTFWALKNQQKTNLWGDIHRNQNLLTPISVTILPFHSVKQKTDLLLNKIESNNYKLLNDFCTLINNKKYSLVIEKFQEILDLLYKYSAGNFTDNDKIVFSISKIFRNLHDYKALDVTRDSCFKLLCEINPPKYSNNNPILDNYDVIEPSSVKILYEASKPNVSLEDENKVSRHNFKDLPVYCIDSEDAHEIDDGVSIVQIGNSNKYTLYVHIADPASYFKESYENKLNVIDSNILKIAYQKGFTTYFPDKVIPMLPQPYTKAADMGKQGIPTRTITFSINVTLNEKERDINLDYSTFKAQLSTVSNFPRVTYDKVDKVLEDRIKETPQCIKSDLNNLYKIAAALRQRRIVEDNAIIFGDDINKGQVKVYDEDDDDNNNKNKSCKRIIFEDSKETPSKVLVTEMMILANTLCGRYFATNKIPGIYRSYAGLQLGSNAQRSYKAIQTQSKEGRDLNLIDMIKISSLLNSGYYTSDATSHDMIGAKQYLTVTSPLRRFPDLLNHIQIHHYLSRNKPWFSQQQVDNMIWQIQSRADMIKTYSKKNSIYWTLKYLQELMHKDSKALFDIVVTSIPVDGIVSCRLANYAFAQGKLKLKKSKSTHHPKIGTKLRNCKILAIEALDNNLEMIET